MTWPASRAPVMGARSTREDSPATRPASRARGAEVVKPNVPPTVPFGVRRPAGRLRFTSFLVL
eukprot:9951986-Alexandrium_andersonii.AAC.1